MPSGPQDALTKLKRRRAYWVRRYEQSPDPEEADRALEEAQELHSQILKMLEASGKKQSYISQRKEKLFREKLEEEWKPHLLVTFD